MKCISTFLSSVSNLGSMQEHGGNRSICCNFLKAHSKLQFYSNSKSGIGVKNICKIQTLVFTKQTKDPENLSVTDLAQLFHSLKLSSMTAKVFTLVYSLL